MVGEASGAVGVRSAELAVEGDIGAGEWTERQLVSREVDAEAAIGVWHCAFLIPALSLHYKRMARLL